MRSIVEKVSKAVSPMLVVLFSFNMAFMPVSYAQVAFLPPVGTLVGLTPKYNPLLVKGVKLFPDNPFKFEFIVDTGDENLSQDQIKDEGQKLSSFFLAALTTPEKEMWVNLSPYEKGRIIPATFGDTEMGKEILAQDYVLKQIMATALYPERQLGREFWNKVYSEAAKRFGTTNVPINTFNKVWIVPNEAVIYENAQMNAVFVVESSLKVMMERDYLAANQQKAAEQFGMGNTPDADLKATSDLSASVIKQIVIPALEKEVNEGKNFSKLRQAYQTLILAAWYKKNLKNSILSKGYVDQGKTLGIDTQDKQITQKIYQQYLKAYKKGAYNYIKEEVDPATQQMIPRKYFSGGVEAMHISRAMTTASPAMAAHFNAAMSASIMANRLIRIIVATTISAAGVLGHGVQTHSTANINSNNNPLYMLDGDSIADPQSSRHFTEEREANPVIHQQQAEEKVSIKSGFVRTVWSTVSPRANNVLVLGSPTIKVISDYVSTLKPADLEAILAKFKWVSPSPPPPPQVLREIIVSRFAAILLAQLKRTPTSPVINRAVLISSLQLLTAQSVAAQTNGNSNSVFLSNSGINDDHGKNVGGIDLEKVNMMIRGGGSKIKTAVDDPRVLKVLLQAQGLFPKVQSIHPIDVPMINLYLGFNTDTNGPIKSADKDSQAIPKSAWLNKTSEIATL